MHETANQSTQDESVVIASFSLVREMQNLDGGTMTDDEHDETTRDDDHDAG